MKALLFQPKPSPVGTRSAPARAGEIGGNATGPAALEAAVDKQSSAVKVAFTF